MIKQESLCKNCNNLFSIVTDIKSHHHVCLVSTEMARIIYDVGLDKDKYPLIIECNKFEKLDTELQKSWKKMPESIIGEFHSQNKGKESSLE
jgi:hypothetical protein